jgi:nitrate reductase gamma subunit
VTTPLNFVAGYALAFPKSALGALIELPQGAHPFYTVLTGGLVALFGAVYLHLARQRAIDRSLLLVGACGKALAVLIALSLYATGQLAALTAALMSGDALFAGLWFYWLRSAAADSRTQGGSPMARKDSAI